MRIKQEIICGGRAIIAVGKGKDVCILCMFAIRHLHQYVTEIPIVIVEQLNRAYIQFIHV